MCLVCYPFHSNFGFAYQHCTGVKKKLAQNSIICILNLIHTELISLGSLDKESELKLVMKKYICLKLHHSICANTRVSKSEK